MIRDQIKHFKREARIAYRRYMDTFDRQSAGHSLAQHMFSSCDENARKFDAALDALGALGESVPDFRLSTQKEGR